MKIFIVLLCVAYVVALKDCSCQKGYQAKPLPVNSETKCYGKRFKMIIPCNTRLRPICKCTGATAVTTDIDGTRCSRYYLGDEVNKWQCENVEDWEEFNRTS